MASNKGNKDNKNTNNTTPPATPPADQNIQDTPPEQTTQQTPPSEQNNQTTSPDEQPEQEQVAPAKLVKFKSRYAKHALNFDGVPKIEFSPVSSRDANEGGIYETLNQRQINALRECDDFKRGIIKEVK